jgi:hypothetical protein
MTPANGEAIAPQSDDEHLAQALLLLPQKVKQVEVTCHLMYADFSYISFYTFCMKKWMAHGEREI